MNDNKLEFISVGITNKLISEIMIKLDEIESTNKSRTKIVKWDFDVDKMELFGEFEYGVKFRRKIKLGGE